MKKRRSLSYSQKKARTGYSFIAPWIIGTAILFVFPMIYSLLTSFSNIKSMSEFQLEWAGLENYKEALLGDVNFVGYFVNSVKDAIINLILIVAFSLFYELCVQTGVLSRIEN